MVFTGTIFFSPGTYYKNSCDTVPHWVCQIGTCNSLQKLPYGNHCSCYKVLSRANWNIFSSAYFRCQNFVRDTALNSWALLVKNCLLAFSWCRLKWWVLGPWLQFSNVNWKIGVFNQLSAPSR